MILSKTAAYALRASLYLAERGRGAPVRADDIAAALDIPRNYLSKILHILARRGLLDSARGPQGGFRMAKAPADTTLLDVVEPFDDGAGGRRCLLGRARCLDDDPCPAHERWEKVAGSVETFFRETTVADLARGTRSGDPCRTGRSVPALRRSVPH